MSIEAEKPSINRSSVSRPDTCGKTLSLWDNRHTAMRILKFKTTEKNLNSTKITKVANLNPRLFEGYKGYLFSQDEEDRLNDQYTVNVFFENEGEIGIAGAMYDVTSGKVEFYEDTIIINQPQEAETMMA